ncbi:MAG: hypothetical protein WDO74_22290 [Pseudomonadota bacterium]
MSLADDRALDEAAAGVSIRDDAAASPAERELAFEVMRARSRLREHSAHLALLAKLRSAQEAVAHEQATDPLTRLQAPIMPNASDDVVVIGCGPTSNFFEFRRDGRRFQYVAEGPVACIPRADWAIENWGSDWIDTKQQAIRLRSTLVCGA